MFNYIPTEIIILSAGSAESIKKKKETDDHNGKFRSEQVGTVETNLSDLYIEVT